MYHTFLVHFTKPDIEMKNWFRLFPMCSLVPSVGPTFVTVTTLPLLNSSPIDFSSYNDEVRERANTTFDFLFSTRHITTPDNFLWMDEFYDI